MRMKRRLEDECLKCGSPPMAKCRTMRGAPTTLHAVPRSRIWIRHGNLEYLVDDEKPSRRLD